MLHTNHIPERTCCGCFKKKPQGSLLAVTKLKDGIIVINQRIKTPGRSAYLCHDKLCIDRARNRKGRDGLSFSLKMAVPDEIWTQLYNFIKKS